jgi:hypothetical protein
LSHLTDPRRRGEATSHHLDQDRAAPTGQTPRLDDGRLRSDGQNAAIEQTGWAETGPVHDQAAATSYAVIFGRGHVHRVLAEGQPPSCQGARVADGDGAAHAGHGRSVPNVVIIRVPRAGVGVRKDRGQVA